MSGIGSRVGRSWGVSFGEFESVICVLTVLYLIGNIWPESAGKSLKKVDLMGYLRRQVSIVALLVFNRAFVPRDILFYDLI